MNPIAGVILTIVLLGANAFFVAAEFALISARRDRLDALIAQGHKRARTVAGAIEKLSLMMAASQLGITVCSILLGKVGEPAIAKLVEPLFALLSVPESLLHPVSFILAMAVVVMLHVLLGEMVPKNIAIAGPELTAMFLVPIHLAICRVISPLIHLCNWSANVVLRLAGVQPKGELDAAVTTAELGAMLADSQASGLLDKAESSRLRRALANSSRTVREVMVPYPAVRAVTAGRDGVAYSDVRTIAADTGFSRYPVLRGGRDFLGYVHIKDLLDTLTDPGVPGTPGGPNAERVFPLSRLHPMPQVPVSAPLEKALGQLRRTSSHIGSVVDARGHTVGIIALEDLIEEFVGTVRDGTHQHGETRG